MYKNNPNIYMSLLFFTFTIATVLFFSFPSIAVEELELKPPPQKAPENVTLKGNVSEDISKARPLTGIGIVGLRFIHQFGFPSYVEQVYPNSPASRAGIQVKDLIYSIDGVKTERLNSDAVFEILSGTPGSTVKISILRGPSMFNVELVREDLANLSSEIQNRYLSGPIIVPFKSADFNPYR